MARRGRRPRKSQWVLATFDALEAWRSAQGLTKTAVALQLGVTNSTYHNWARGTAVATPRMQERIQQLVRDGVPAPSATSAPMPVAPSVVEATGKIVAAYTGVGGGGRGLDLDGLVQLIKTVRSALA